MENSKLNEQNEKIETRIQLQMQQNRELEENFRNMRDKMVEQQSQKQAEVAALKRKILDLETLQTKLRPSI